MNATFLYVALLWFGAVLAWRRFGGRFPWRIAVCFYLLVLIFLFRPLTQAWVSLPMDYLFRLAPWHELQPGVRPHNAELNDLTLQIVPWAHQVREAWTRFEAPLWNPAAAAGYPLLANGQSAAFSLLRWAALPLPLDYAFACEAALKLLLALGGTWLFLRRRGASEAAALIGAVSFGFSTALVIWLHFPLATVAAWLPVTFLGIDLLLERLTWRRFVLLTLAFTQLLLGGHPETAAHVVFAGGIFLLFRVLAAREETPAGRLGAVLRVVGAGVVALLISLPQVLPLLEALPSTKRWDMLQEFPDLHERPTNARFLVNFIQPSFFGTVRDGTAWGPAHAEVIAGFGGIFLMIGWVAGLSWAIARRRWRDERFLYALLVPLFVAIALNWPVVSDAFESLPLFSIAANSRVRLLVVWFGALLAAAAVDLLRSGTRWPIGLGAAVTGSALAAAFALNPLASGSDPLVWAVATSVPAALVIATAAGLAALPARRLRDGALAVLLVLVVADVWVHVIQWNAVLPRSWFYPRTPIITRMMRIAAAPAPDDPLVWRMTGTNGMLFPNTAAIYGLEDIRGHDPMANGRVLGVLRVFAGYTSDSYFGMLRDVSHPLIDYLNVRYVLTSRSEDLPAPAWERVYEGPDGKIFRNLEALPRFFAVERVITEFDDERRKELLLRHREWATTAIVKRLPTRLMPLAAGDLFDPLPADAPRTSVRLTRASGDAFEMEVDAPRWTLVVSSQPDWPGWKVVRNGSERLKTIKANVAFMGFLVPPGKSTIRVYYAPRSYWVGCWISLATMAGVAGAAVLSERRRRRAAPL